MNARRSKTWRRWRGTRSVRSSHRYPHARFRRRGTAFALLHYRKRWNAAPWLLDPATMTMHRFTGARA